MITFKLFMFNFKRKEVTDKGDYDIDVLSDSDRKDKSIKIINDIINYSILERKTSDKFKYYLLPVDFCENLKVEEISKYTKGLDFVIKINAYTSPNDYTNNDLLVGLTIDPCDQLDDYGEIMSDLDYQLKLNYTGLKYDLRSVQEND